VRPEKHFGTVKDNADPDKLGALKVEAKTLVDGTPLQDDWVPGKFPFAGKGEGFYYVPEKGSLVEVDVEAEPGKAAESLDARWTSARYTKQDKIPEEFQSNPTKRGGIKFGKEVFLQDKAKALTALISGKVRLGEEDCTHPLVRGDTYNTQLDFYLTGEDAYLTAENTLSGNLSEFFTALKAALQVWQALPPGVPATNDLFIVFATAVKPSVDVLASGAVAWTGAIVAFKAVVAAFKAAKVSWLSTKCKTE
jgi:hypothetical protein